MLPRPTSARGSRLALRRVGRADAVLRAGAYGRRRLVRMVRPQWPYPDEAAAEREKLQAKLDLAKAKVLRRAPKGR